MRERPVASLAQQWQASESSFQERTRGTLEEIPLLSFSWVGAAPPKRRKSLPDPAIGLGVIKPRPHVPGSASLSDYFQPFSTSEAYSCLHKSLAAGQKNNRKRVQITPS